jgi:adenine-specific DNA-methyltransferase
MNTIGTVLKDLREQNGLQLQQVHKKTKINLTLLSRIENGKRMPTKEQVLKLVKQYKCDKKDVMVHWISDKVVYDVQEEEYGIEALQLAEEKILYGQQNNGSLFPSTQVDKPINLESRRYIGSKAKLTNWILDTIKSETNNSKTFLDIFAGTASVAKAAFNNYDIVIVNDTLIANNFIYKAFFQTGKWNREKLEIILNNYNQINASEISENYFSKNFGNKFFEHAVSKIIGHIRQDIEDRKDELTEKEYSILITTLIYNIDKVANTVGHYDAYIKKPIRIKNLRLRLIEPNDFAGIKIYKQNANELARKIKADIVYIDPPYNSRQYSRFYHLYETLVKWDKPKLHGVALKPIADNMSVYCTVKAKDAFKDLVDNLDVKYFAVSYNNTYNSKSHSSENKIKLEEIEYILNQRGKTKVFECSHRFFNTGKTEFNDHKELLFITKVNGKA